MNNSIVLTDEMRHAFLNAVAARSALEGGFVFPGAAVVCGCGSRFPLGRGTCPRCAASAELAAPLFPVVWRDPRRAA